MARVTPGSRLSQAELEKRGARAAKLLSGLGEVLLANAVAELLAHKRDRR